MNVLAPVIALIVAMMIITSTLLTSYLDHRLWRNNLRAEMLSQQCEMDYIIQEKNEKNTSISEESQGLPLEEEENEEEEEAEKEGEQKETQQNDPKSYPRSPTSGKLNITLLFHDEGKDSSLYLLTKQLIESLYGNKEFFRSAREKFPNLTDIFLTSLIENPKNASSSLNDLAKTNFDINDDERNKELRNCFIEMFKGSRGNTERDWIPISLFIKKEKNPSIKTQKKVNVYLAKPELLQAIFQNPTIVHDICELRTALYKEIHANKKKADDATKELEEKFLEMVPSHFASLVHFKASTTNPNKK